MKQYARVFRYLARYKSNIGLYLLTTVLSIVFSLVSIGMLMPFLQLIFLKETSINTKSNIVLESVDKLLAAFSANDNIAKLGIICLLIVVFIILKNLFLYLSYYILNPLKNKIVNKMREDVYDKVLKLPIGYFNERRKGDLLSRMTTDIGEVEGSLIGSMEGWVRDPLTIIITLIFLLVISPKLTIFILFLIPVMGLVIGRITKSLKKHSNIVAV